jgi:HD-like signal output (HDOD) protein
MPQHILFVDDNPLMLAGLGRMLRPMRHEWDMAFAPGGAAALAAIEASSYDVIVSDMRMPDIDGAELLRYAIRIQPRAMRIILSGQASYGASLRSVQTAHQCLSKPCEMAMLTGKIGPALARRAPLGGEEIAVAVSEMTTLPSRPEAHRHLLAELQTPNPSTHHTAEIIASDLGMTCKLLQVANSAFFSNDRRQTLDVGHAVRRLGLDIVRQLAVSAGAFNEFDCQELLPFVEELSIHSIETRDRSEVVATSKGLARPIIEAASTAGLLHDVGKLVFAAIYGPRYGQILRRAREEQVPLWCVERDHLGASHADVGAYLLALWGLSEPVVDAVAHHHHDEGPVSEFSARTVLQAVLRTQRLQSGQHINGK